MVIKKLLPLILMIGALAIPTSSNEATVAKAEEPIQVKSGYITKNLVNSEKGYIDLDNESIKTLFENNFEGLQQQDIYYDDGILYNIMGSERIDLETTSENATNTYIPVEYRGIKVPVMSAVSRFSYSNAKLHILKQHTYCTITHGLDYRLAGTDFTKPLELALSIRLNAIESFLTKYCTINLTLPIVSINGYDYFTLNFKAEDKSITYTSSNSRAYVSHVSDTDDDGNTIDSYGDYVFLEIPYTQSLRTIKTFDYRFFSPVGGANTLTDFKVLKGTLTNSIRTPLTISNIDFNTGKVVVNSSNSTVLNEDGERVINAITCKYYKLTAITFNDGTKLYAKPLNKHPSNRQEEYELYVDSDFKTLFTYNTNNALAIKLRNAQDDATFYVKKLDYDTMTKTSETSDYVTKSDIVDCKTYYAFKKISKDQIHTVTFDTIHAKNAFYTRLAFSAYDDDTRVYIDKINALWFKYSFNNKDYNFTINSKDFEKSVSGGDQYNFWFGNVLNNVNNIVKQDKATNVSFTLTGMKTSDYICFNWSYNPALKQTSNNDMFLIYTAQDVYFEGLVSCIYVDKKGDIINASADLPDGSLSPTAVIAEDGSVTVWDKNGNQIDGTVDKDGNFVTSDGKIRENANNVDNTHDKANQKKWEDILDTLKKILALIPTIAIGVGVVWLIGKLGPSIINLFKKKE